jgi:uncharacterized protein (UPF0548 family)
MFSFRKPTADQLAAYLQSVAGAPFTYHFPRCTDTRGWQTPRGWNRDHERRLLGSGREVFQNATEAIRGWEMFPRAIAELCSRDCPIETGRVVAVVYRSPFCWMLFPARIVYTIDETLESAEGTIARFGFAYGTIADHAELGEERFLVEWNRSNDEVWYDLLAISRPGHWLARLGYPYTRYEQARFRRLSCNAMAEAARGSESSATTNHVLSTQR